MTKAELDDQRYNLYQAIKLNKKIVRNGRIKEKDDARMRIKILYRKIDILNEKIRRKG